jgi:hypothetical protein
MRTVGIVMVLLLITTIGRSQTVVTNEEEYEQEELQSRSETEHDLSDREELLDHLTRNPIPINFADPDQLSEIPWLNDLQIRNLLLYRKLYGYIVSPYELQLIEGFDRETIESIIPYINFTKDKNKRKITAHALFNEGDDDFLFRPSGLGKPKDSAYMGSPVKLLLKYKYDWQSRVTAGFIIEKDPGEPLFKKPLKKIPGIDYASAYIMISNTGIFKRLIIGDYHLRFGQGLAVWSGYNIGRTIFASGYTRKAPGIVQNSSAMETGFMRGAAASFTFKKFNITGFFSASPSDGRLDTINKITSLVTDGLHRDSMEWNRRHNLTQVSYGGRFAWKQDVSVIGINVISGFYSKAFAVPSALYRKYDFTGSQFGNMSLDHRIVLGKLLLSGEVAVSRLGEWAIIQNMLLQPLYGYTFFLSIRDYSPAYRAPFGNCLGESGLPQNEKGVFAAITMLLSPKVTIRTFADFYSYPWLKYRIDAPSSGYEQQLQLEWKASPITLLILRIGNKNRPWNMPVDSNMLNKVENQHRLNIRLNLKNQLGKQITIQSRVEWNQLVKTVGKSEGYLFLQDFAWKGKKERFGFTARFAYYSASYDNRFYTYENDHLFSFTTPMLYGEGTHMYLFGRIRFLKKQTLTFKIGSTKSVIKTSDVSASTDTTVTNSTSSNPKNSMEVSVQFIFKI